MKNKIELKKLLIKILLTCICLISSFLIFNIYEYHVYTNNFNNKINSIIETLHNYYPNLNEKEIIDILNNDKEINSNILNKYGINLDNKSIVLENDIKYHKFLIINLSLLIIGLFILIYLFIHYLKNRDKDIKDITKYIEQLNNKNYSLKIDSNSEDELSILKNEIYKTTVTLKEVADISKKDKINLKVSLEDISHQLKTPLTSILVMLDNLIDEPDMEINTRQDFIKDIKRNVMNINFLVQSILKLSKFDSNTIDFIKKEQYIKEILNEVNKNVSILCDLKNIKLNIKGNKEAKIYCDYMWEVEAITNIVKNCVEHSPSNKKIDIFYEENKAYLMITIRDYGNGIEKEDLPHIFERFYKGKNSSPDSIGIGLALSKAIIEKDNGVISVNSSKSGTEFKIKYFKI